MAAFHLIIYGRFWVITEDKPSKEMSSIELMRTVLFSPQPWYFDGR
jgi:hypothetical protein